MTWTHHLVAARNQVGTLLARAIMSAIACVINTPTTLASPVYQGGPVMHGTTNVHLIWYGDNWGDNTAMQIIPDFLNSLGGSPYYDINTTYWDEAGSVSNALVLSDQYLVPAILFDDPNETLGTSSVLDLVRAVYPQAEKNGVYLVLGDPTVREHGDFINSCGWHHNSSYYSRDYQDIKFAWISGLRSGEVLADGKTPCSAQPISPNGNAIADAMVSIIAHEIDEMVTDPMLNAWGGHPLRDAENGDLCAWRFGRVYRTENGSLANIKLGGRDYLVQENWANVFTDQGGGCTMAYPDNRNQILSPIIDLLDFPHLEGLQPVDQIVVHGISEPKTTALLALCLGAMGACRQQTRNSRVTAASSNFWGILGP